MTQIFMTLMQIYFATTQPRYFGVFFICRENVINVMEKECDLIDCRIERTFIHRRGGGIDNDDCSPRLNKSFYSHRPAFVIADLSEAQKASAV
jgi:hypothetical protein